MWDFVRNNTVNLGRYKTHSEAVIVSCYFNPQKSEYRKKAFDTFYDSIKHLNHHIIECVIGNAEPELPQNANISRVSTPNLLWHKESLLNLAIKKLPPNYKYVFWVDADVLFTNKNWLVDGVKQLGKSTIIQPFEYCVHLDKDELEPSFPMEALRRSMLPNKLNPMVWRSFAANYATSDLWQDLDYNNHGHVGFAWAARREVLEKVSLYDKALAGGADHIIAHAAAGQIGHPCIHGAFVREIPQIRRWSPDFNRAAQGKLGFVEGELHHLWHGNVNDRDYYRRIKGFENISDIDQKRDENGLHRGNDDIESFMTDYFARREAPGNAFEKKPSATDDFKTGGRMDSRDQDTFVTGGRIGSLESDKFETGGRISSENDEFVTGGRMGDEPAPGSRDYTPFS